MTSSGVFPKIDGDVLYGVDVNILHNRSQGLRNAKYHTGGSTVGQIVPISGNNWYGLEYSTNHIMVTTNSGATWSTACSGAAFTGIVICRNNPYLAFAVGDTGSIWRCNFLDNNGSPWKGSNLNVGFTSWDGDFVSNTCAWVGTTNNVVGSFGLFYSKDAGSTWTMPTSGTNNGFISNVYGKNCVSVNFYNENSGFAEFYLAASNYSHYYTSNGGSNWTYCGTSTSRGELYSINGSEAIVLLDVGDNIGSSFSSIGFIDNSIGSSSYHLLEDTSFGGGAFTYPFSMNGSHYFIVKDINRKVVLFSTVNGKDWENRTVGVGWNSNASLSYFAKCHGNDNGRWKSGCVLFSLCKTNAPYFIDMIGGL